MLMWILMLLSTLLCYRLRQTHNFWERQHVPFIQPQLCFGNLKNLFLLRVSFGELFQSLYNAVEAPVVGVYMLHTPALIIRQPELIERILIKDFACFLNRYEAADPKHDAMGSLHLALSKYHIWRPSRIKISEFFTSGRLKHSLYTKMLEIAGDLEQTLSKNCAVQILEVKTLATLFTTDVTAYLLYGFKAQGLLNNGSEIQQLALELLTPSLSKTFNFLCMFFLPHQTTRLKTKCFTKKYENYFRNLVKESKSTQVGYSLLDFLKKAQTEQKILKHDDFLAAQAAIFLLAGFETSSSLIAFTLYELAKQQPIQKRLRLEIKQSFEKQQFLSYESLTELPYLQQCVAESLRLYPAAAFINRECTAGKDNEYSLEPFSNVRVPTGMPLYISILGLHRNEKYWPNPLIYNPERFSVEHESKIQPMTYIPFGAGPHGCVGKRLAYLQIKLGLVHILKHYQVETCAMTPKSIEFEPTSFMLQSKSGIQLRFIKDEC